MGVIMEELKLLLKYSYKNKVRPTKNKRGKEVHQGLVSTLISYLILPIIFLAVMMPTLILTLNSMNLNVPLSQLGLNLNHTLLDLLFAPSFLLVSALFILQYSPLLVTTLYDNDMTDLLLSMPIKRSSLFFSASIDSFIMSGIGTGAFFSMTISYSILSGSNIFFAVISIIGFLLFVISISLFLGLVMSFFIRKTSAKRIAQLIYFIGFIFMVLLPQFLPSIISDNPEDMIELLENNMKVFLNPIWPHVHFLNALDGNVFSLIFLYALSFLLFYCVYRYSNNLDFTVARKKSKRVKVQKFKVSRWPIIEKDRKLLFRNSQLLFMMLYPLIFPFIFIFTGMQNLSYIAIFFLLISGTYTSLTSAYMLIEELKIWPIPKLFPFSARTLVNSKILLSSSIFTLEFIIILIVFSFMVDFNIFDVFLIIPTIILLYYSSLFGARLFLSNPKRDLSQSNKVFTGKETLILELITMGYAAAIFGLLAFYNFMLNQGPVWIFKNLGMPLTSLIILGGAVVLVLIIIRSIKKEQEKINRYLEIME